jgi:integrase
MPAYQDRHGRWRYRFAYRGSRHGGSTPAGANTKKAALQLERDHLERLMSHRYTGKMPTVAEFVEKFLEYQRAHVKPLTVDLNETQLRRHTVPHIGKLKLDEVTRLELDGLVTEWSKTAAPTTVNTRIGTVARMFAMAVEWEILRTAPKATGVKVAPVTPRFLSEAEAAELLAASRFVRVDANDWHSMILVGLRTGLRVGELRGLQWADVTLRQAKNDAGELVDVGAVHVMRTDPGDGSPPTSPKSNATRVVPLTPDAVRCLRARLESERARLGKRWAPDVSVWPSPSDHRRTMSTVACQAAMDRYTARAKLEDVSWHTLRHTFASWLVMRGVPLRAVQELLGHHDMKMTMRYAHLAPGFAHAAAVASLDFPLVAPDQPALPLPNETARKRTSTKKQLRLGPGSQRAAKRTPRRPKPGSDT